MRSASWAQGRPSVLRRDTPLALALSACARDGWIRERAVRLLPPDDDDLLPVLAIRSTDWAVPVRDAALRLLAGVLADPPPHRFQTLLAMAAAMRDRSRAADLVSLVDAALRRAPGRLLEPALACADRYARRHAVRVAAEAGLLSVERLVRVAVEDPDRVTAVRSAEAAAALTKDAAVFAPLLRSPVPTLRALALTRPALAGDAGLCAPYLEDRARVVRETARLGLRRAGLDPAARYRAVLQERVTQGGIAGLAETGGAEDAGLVRRHLEHPRPAVRAEAVRALHALGGGDRDTLLAMLRDPSGRVVRQAGASLRGHSVPEDLVWPLVAAGRPPAIRRAAQRLLHEQGAWTRLRADLLLIKDADPVIRMVATTDVRVWLRTQHHLPVPPQGMIDLLENAADVLDERAVRELRFLLGLRPVRHP